MNAPELAPFVGQLTFDRLFIGSKSEGIYPVLSDDQGRTFRLHIKGASLEADNSLICFSGKRVRVLGVADNLRGHRRIVLESLASIDILDELPVPNAIPNLSKDDSPTSSAGPEVQS